MMNSIVFSNFHERKKKKKKERNLYNNVIRKFELHHGILQNRYDATPRIYSIVMQHLKQNISSFRLYSRRFLLILTSSLSNIYRFITRITSPAQKQSKKRGDIPELINVCSIWQQELTLGRSAAGRNVTI